MFLVTGGLAEGVNSLVTFGLGFGSGGGGNVAGAIGQPLIRGLGAESKYLLTRGIGNFVSTGGGTIVASSSADPPTFGVKPKLANAYHHPTLATIGTSAPSAGSPSVAAGNGTANYFRQSLTIQNQHASATLSVFFGATTNPAYLLAAGQSIIDYSQDAVWLQSSAASTSVYLDPVY